MKPGSCPEPVFSPGAAPLLTDKIKSYSIMVPLKSLPGTCTPGDRQMRELVIKHGHASPLYLQGCRGSFLTERHVSESVSRAGTPLPSVTLQEQRACP